MAEKKPYAYRLERIVPKDGFFMATAALMTCAVTGKVLSTSGGGGEYISPEVRQVILKDQEVQELIKRKIAELDAHPIA
jgi:hypothetical protein